MRIFYPIGAFYPDESGGPSLTTYWIIQAIASKGYQCVVLTTNHGIKSKEIIFDEWLIKDWGKIKYIRTSNLRLAFKLMFLSIKQIYLADIVHLTSIFYPPTIFCFFVARLFNKQIIWSPRGSIDDRELIYNEYIKKKCILFLKYFINKKTFFHTTCEEESNFTKKQFGENINIFEIPNYMILPQRVDVPKEKILLFVGRFHPKKGIDVLLRAVKESKYFLNSEFKLKIAGNYNNEYGNIIIQLYENLNLGEKVEFLGAVTGVEKQELFAKAYFSFMPSTTENFGIVVTEALAQGTPVVATIHSPWETLELNKAGFWSNNTIEDLTKIIDIIIDMSPIEYEQYSKNAFNLVNKEFDIYINVERWIKAYENLVH